MRLRVIVLVALFALVPLAEAAGEVEPAEAKAVLRIASKLSGLPVRRGVPVVTEPAARYARRRLLAHDRFYPASVQSYDEALYTALGLTSVRGALRKAIVAGQKQPTLYDPQTRKLYVPPGRVSRVALAQGLVFALQDQAFDLERGRLLAGSRDAGVAASAAIVGHASLVAGLVAPSTTPSPRRPALIRFLELETGFASTVGKRFAATLRNLGGKPAVFSSLRRFPATTEQIFHIDKFLEREQALPIALPVDAAGLTLVGDNTFGELDVRALLATFDVAHLNQVGEGWGGGRSAIYRAPGREAAVLALDWDEELDAVEWGEAVPGYVDGAFDAEVPGQPAQTQCAATACWSLEGHTIAFERAGARTALVFGPDIPTAARLARTILGLPNPRLDG